MMRLSLLSLLLLTAATGTSAVAAQPAVEEAAEQAPAPRAPEPVAHGRTERPLRVSEPGPRPARSEWVERRPRSQDVEVLSQTASPQRRERAEAFARRQASPDPVTGDAAATVARPRRQGWGGTLGNEASDRRRGDNGASTEWRDRRGERRDRNGDLPPAVRSPVFGSAIPTPVTVAQPPREVRPGSVATGSLRGRTGAEGSRPERIGRESWRREWRGDRRYDWRRFRDRDRSRFHLGIYIDPFGWQYRDYEPGWRLPPRYYASRYWILDHDRFRLPPVGGPYRWVRYHNDVLLVDLRNGRVLDRIRGFFW